MTRTQTVCNACQKEIAAEGYAVSFSSGAGELGVDIKRGADPAWERHYCGRSCMTIALNVWMNELDAAGGPHRSPA